MNFDEKFQDLKTNWTRVITTIQMRQPRTGLRTCSGKKIDLPQGRYFSQHRSRRRRCGHCTADCGRRGCGKRIARWCSAVRQNPRRAGRLALCPWRRSRSALLTTGQSGTCLSRGRGRTGRSLPDSGWACMTLNADGCFVSTEKWSRKWFILLYCSVLILLNRPVNPLIAVGR